MKASKLLQYQEKAFYNIQEALARRQKRIVVEMPTGFGKGMVFSKTIEYLQQINDVKILVVVGNLQLKEQLTQNILSNHNVLASINSNNIVIETEQRIRNNSYEKINSYDIVILYEAIFRHVDRVLEGIEKTVIIFSTIGDTIIYESKKRAKPYSPEDVVFSYTYQEALKEGYITPAMDTKAREPAFEYFSKQLLEGFGYTQIEYTNKNIGIWDLVLEKNGQKFWVECKAYKSETISPTIANDLLKTLVMRKMKQKISPKDIILLIVSSNIPSFQKKDIFDRYRIVVLDIENLVFYSRNDLALLKRLSQITYYPIDHIQGQALVENELLELFPTPIAEESSEYIGKETTQNEIFIKELKDCPAGRENSREYEELCERILRHFFEANYFNRLTSQHKTADEHFRMDLIGALKITQNNNESMHPFWQMLVQHYNSHFVVFEFKNYTEEIDQNLIYITEKYLFDAALRNVAIIISRKGFSTSAKFAAKGCLKEHGKLILDINNEDIINMLKAPGDDPADYLLTKLEEFLMEISK